MRLLIVDDSELWCSSVATYLSRDGFEVEAAFTLDEARRRLAKPPPILILDQRLPDGEGLSLAEELFKRKLDTRILVVTGHPQLTDAVHSLRLRIDDYLAKPIDLEVLRHAVLRTREAFRFERNDKLHKRQIAFERAGSKLTGAGLEGVRRLVRQLGPSQCTVLITGETGCGKSLVAKALHYANKTDRPFVKINCAAMPDELAEAELFGVERGAYTGAVNARQGLFELANGGSLFLDEIGELSPKIQAKLLGVLEDGEVRRVGGDWPRPFEVRIIAATNIEMERAIGEGRFRRDLFFRLNIGRIEVPPLRARLGDLPELIETLLENYRAQGLRLAEGELAIMSDYPWPGNVRELKNLLERAVLLQENGWLRPTAFLSSGMGKTESAMARAAPDDSASVLPLRQMEMRYIKTTLARFDGHRERTAKALRIGVATLRRKLKDDASI